MKLIFFLFLFTIFVSCQTEKVTSLYPEYVGNINFDGKLDSPDFKRCHKDYGIQYYNSDKGSGTEYKGEMSAIIRQIEKWNISSSKASNGYITIRFLVNCEGNTGLFRVQQMNEEYQKQTFDKKLVDELLSFTKKLEGWEPKFVNGKKIDYYQYLTFKIENGKISEILP